MDIENDIPTNESEADSLIESIDTPESSSIADAPPQAEQQAAWQPPTTEIPFRVGDKELKVKWDQLTKWAEMGYGAPTKIGALNKELETWKQKEKTFSELESRYGPIDSYVRQNPQFWQHVVDAYQRREQALTDQSNPLAQTVQSLQQELEDLKNFKSAFEAERTQERVRKEDEEYINEFTGLKKAYPDIDFDSPGEDGKSLEYKVLEYANANGIKKFEPAFLAFYHKELVAREKEGAKQALVKNRVNQAKQGIIGKSSTPTKGVAEYSRNKSYQQLAEEALAELQAGKYG